MKSAWILVFPFLTIFTATPADNEAQDDTPRVKIITPDENKTYTWNEQVRYSISVYDSKDGDSKYDEIASNECSLSITYLPGNKETAIKQIREQHIEPGLLLMKRSNCFGCHAHKAKLAGPSFEEIATRYGTDEAIVKNLSLKILNGSIGAWGDQQMPGHDDLTADQCRQIAAYILKIGNRPDHWIYSGLEGTFRIMDKPKTDLDGIYVLTAGYTSRSGKEGKHSVVLKVR